MILECPHCATRYELDDARLTGPNPILKCSRCRHIFPAPSSEKQPPTPPSHSAGKPPPADAENLTLPFGASAWKEAEPPARDADTLVPDDGFTLGAEEPAGHTGRSRDPQPDISATADDERTVEPDAGMEPARARNGRQHRMGSSDPRRSATTRRDRSRIGPIFIFLALVAVGYALLTRALFANPVLCDRLLRRLPLIGAWGDDRLLTRSVTLSKVGGQYQRIRDRHEVFVITGTALNTAPVALHSVQIIGKLYDNAGTAVDQKTISCGNVISAKVLKDLTRQEVSILQQLSPPRRFAIDPGESSSFVIVFMDPPPGAVQFSAQVLAAQRHA